MREPCSDNCTNDSRKLWGKGIVSYCFDNGVSKNLIHSVKSAMKEISEASSIRFVKRTDQFDYVKIVDKGSYWSYVVTNGWPHPIGSAIHELMHALGIYHEHCRPDRDKYVTIKDDIKNNTNYKRLKKSNVVSFGPYDFKSIMHYSLGPDMTSKQEVNDKIGQRFRMSEGDIYALNKLYPSTSCSPASDDQIGLTGKSDAKKMIKRNKSNFEQKIQLIIITRRRTLYRLAKLIHYII
ncbi:hypothetical protein RclHR1_05130003 [Rhizophagus clarus]|uniref:Metalloendopeptidase n=1 Tax=Rhizophagus clarus TaxID=94130 RepID=A0A2Z6RMM1_9GLOM|nr:hypothetical protein RclHR1_05130003 [Rhizophagus clarus]